MEVNHLNLFLHMFCVMSSKRYLGSQAVKSELVLSLITLPVFMQPQLKWKFTSITCCSFRF